MSGRPLRASTLSPRLLPPPCGFPPECRPEWARVLDLIATADLGQPTFWERLGRLFTRKRGLTTSQLRQIHHILRIQCRPAEQQSFFTYAAACRAWYAALEHVVASSAAGWDWRMMPAQHAPINAAEQALGDALKRAGLAADAQLGVSSRGGPRRGGWMGNWWLDFAHRDPDYLLKIDIELDGRHHRYADRAERDERRNETLQARGWYVYRIPGLLITQRREDAAVAELLQTVHDHHRAVVAACLDPPSLERLCATF